MNDRFDRQRLQKWLEEIASTEDEELDCNDLEAVIERVVAVGESGEDISELLPAIAVHLDHCPECTDWYDALVAFARGTDT